MSLSKFITEAKARGTRVTMEGQTFRRTRINSCDETFVENRRAELQAEGLYLTGEPGALFLAWS